jgi:acyl-CoA reductase-like NAD-dependent aldehyde dehydrogenase
MNAGQTRVAPDFVHGAREARDPFVAARKEALHEFYGDNSARCEDYGRIVNQEHPERLVTFLSDGKVVHGGRHDVKNLLIAPTLLADAAPDAAVMPEEICEPILPALECDELDEALAMLRDRPTPLALCVFTRDRTTEARVLADARSSGACLNDVVSHLIGAGLSFGGLGRSGMGAYHGRADFEALTHQRAVLPRATCLDLTFRYLPLKPSLGGLKRAMRLHWAADLA